MKNVEIGATVTAAPHVPDVPLQNTRAEPSHVILPGNRTHILWSMLPRVCLLSTNQQHHHSKPRLWRLLNVLKVFLYGKYKIHGKLKKKWTIKNKNTLYKKLKKFNVREIKKNSAPEKNKVVRQHKIKSIMIHKVKSIILKTMESASVPLV